jgi:hypothetical protein
LGGPFRILFREILWTAGALACARLAFLEFFRVQIDECICDTKANCQLLIASCFVVCVQFLMFEIDFRFEGMNAAKTQKAKG